MTRSEADTERELEEGESAKADSTKLAQFLTPVPRPKSSMPPPPSSSALRAAPVPPIPEERASLFSDLPVPRKNSSLRPPAAVTEAPHAEPPRAEAPRIEMPRAEAPRIEMPRAEAPRVEMPRAEAPRVEMPRAEAPRVEMPRVKPRAQAPEWETSRNRARAGLGGFEETESPIGSLTLEKSLGEQDESDGGDLDHIPLARAPLGRVSARRAAIAAGALIAVVAIVVVAKRALSPAPAAAPSSSAATMPPLPREPNAPTDDTLEPAEDVEFPPSAADPAKGLALRRQARELLEKGNAEEGVKVSRLAIQADPNDPEGYILLAAGLQDLGRWQESRDVFAKCVQESSRRANAECVYFATRNK